MIRGPGAYRPNQDAGVDAGDASDGFAGAYGNMNSAGASGGMAMQEPEAWADDLADDSPQVPDSIGLGLLKDMFINDTTTFYYMHPRGLLVGKDSMIYLAPRSGAHESWVPPTGELIHSVDLRGNRLAVALVHTDKTIKVITLDITRQFKQGSEFTVTDWPADTVLNGNIMQISDERVILKLSPPQAGAEAHYATYKLDSGVSIGMSSATTRASGTKVVPNRDAFVEMWSTTQVANAPLIVQYSYYSVRSDNIPSSVGLYSTIVESDYTFAGEPTTRLYTLAGRLLDISEAACEGAEASASTCMKDMEEYLPGELAVFDTSPQGHVFAMLEPTLMCTVQRLDVISRRVHSMKSQDCQYGGAPRDLLFDPWSGTVLYIIEGMRHASEWLEYE